MSIQTLSSQQVADRIHLIGDRVFARRQSLEPAPTTADDVDDLRQLARRATPDHRVIRSLVRAGDVEAMRVHLSSHPASQCAAAIRNTLFVAHDGPIPAAMLDLLADHMPTKATHGLGFLVLIWGFELGDEGYARRSTRQFELPEKDLRSTIPLLLQKVSCSTAGYLAEIMRSAANSDRRFLTERLLLIAWADACPRLMSALAWLGVTPGELHGSRVAPPSVRPAIELHASSISSAHDMIELHHEYPSLAGLLISDIPLTLRDEE